MFNIFLSYKSLVLINYIVNFLLTGFATVVLTLEDNMLIPVCKDALLWLIKQICWIIFESRKLCKLDVTGTGNYPNKLYYFEKYYIYNIFKTNFK